ncbi:hypothetical protein Ddye_013361 [Dipteronia dyeriana]|uniref:Reverse transcriptase zinc-binding domain-containing protein n=1 Tax=Dipteronia dyeriana TaxID=168575 RepID=A0AAD9X617_9ROSI|nr:hypothetical protein Ddye_013361 [Dipteronia dyeriana]
MCTSKEGGLGFREFELFNRALITDSGGWNIDLLHNIVIAEDVDQILSFNDSLIWHFDKSGEYSVRIGYRVAKGMALVGVPSASSLEDLASWWRTLWRLKISSKIKLFMWLACHNRLSALVSLAKGGVPTEIICPRCRQSPESVLHALWGCRVLHQVRNNCSFVRGISLAENLHFLDFMLGCLRCLQFDNLELSCVVFWIVWFGRNQLVFNSIEQDVGMVVSWAVLRPCWPLCTEAMDIKHGTCLALESDLVPFQIETDSLQLVKFLNIGKLDFLLDSFYKFFPDYGDDTEIAFDKSNVIDSLIFDDDIVLGRDFDYDDIVNTMFQNNDEEKLRFIPIVDMGRIRKTVLARRIYNNEWVESHFQFRVWVSVGRYLDIATVAEHWAFRSREQEHAEFEKIGLNKVAKCKGLPLAVEIISGLLRSKSVQEWFSVMRDGLLKLP